MLKLIKGNLSILRYLLISFLFIGAIILHGIIETPRIKYYFPFTGAILLYLLTLLLLKIQGKKLTHLGLNITFKNLSYLGVGLFIGIGAFLLISFIKTIGTDSSWQFNTEVDSFTLFHGFYLILASAAVQELLFRGYLFQKVLEDVNFFAANILFGTLFTLAHILDFSVIQNVPKLIYLLITIPVGHLLFAVAYQKSATLFFPIGLHWGNNWISTYLIASKENESTIFVWNNELNIDTWPHFIFTLLLFNLFYLLITWLIWKFLKVKKS
ncbi:MAG: CPBP family intramembrane glutamic endopeptidase [Nitrososphaeraceae archaeon]|nr:CPBP family intramembrane glutamic endopeptidase [Nitrososphaeraceae archaeon]